MPSHQPRLLLVTGPGRSGTSSVAGSLHHLGWHVPLPMVPAGERNPKGHFEPVWSILFHKKYLAQAGFDAHDSRPGFPGLLDAELAATAALDELTEWLRTLDAEEVVVKDPHASGFIPMWREAAERAGRDLRVLLVVRHPAEVVGSRYRTWGKGRSEEARLVSETRNSAQWVNTLLVCEEQSRDVQRAFIRYADLLDDWRGALGAVSRQLDLDLDLDLSSDGPHVLDSWLDPEMRRVDLGWDGLRVADSVRDLAQRVWDQVDRLVETPHDPQAEALLADVRADYAILYRQSLAIVDDELRFRRLRQRDEVARLRRRLRRARSSREVPPPAPARRSVLRWPRRAG